MAAHSPRSPPPTPARIQVGCRRLLRPRWLWAAAALLASGPALAAPDDAVDIPDAALRNCVEHTLGLTTGATITEANMESLTSLFCEGDRPYQTRQGAITSLAGLQFAVNLDELHISRNAVADLSPIAALSLTELRMPSNNVRDFSVLARLESLRKLSIGGNPGSNLSPLAGLTSLTHLWVVGSSLVDISPLENLLALQQLHLGDNEITDISPLKALTSLELLGLSDNALEDLSGLADLTSLAYLAVSINNIWDISALTANAGIGERGTEIVLHANPLGCAALAAITALRNEGAKVFYSDTSAAAPAAPENLAVELAGSGGATLTWDGDSTAHVFEARHRTGDGTFGGWTRVLGGGESRRHEVTGLAGGVHVFQVRGVNSTGCGAAAQVSAGTVEAALVADAGEDQSVAEDRLARLDGGGSSGPEGVALVFSWRQSAGEPAVALTGADTAAPSFNAPNLLAPATLTFELTVTAGEASDSDTVDVTVDADNDPPTARAGPDQTVVAGAAVALDGGASSDPEGETLAYSWRQSAGAPTVALAEADTATPSFRAPDVAGNATLTFELTATAGGASGSDTVDVTVLTAASVAVPDAALRRCLLRELGKPAGAAISNDDMASLTSVDCPGAPLDGCLNPAPWDTAAVDANGGISRLDGLERAVNLVELRLPDQAVADLGPISRLWSLSTLRLGNNALDDISALSGLTALTELALDGNRVSDIGALSGLRALERLWLNGNEIRDIAPLLANESLGGGEVRTDGSGDYIDLRGNPLDASAVETHAPLLRERGAAVLVDDGSRAVPLFLAGGSPFGESFVRVVNHADGDGEVSVTAVDAAGRRHGPVALTVGANRTAQFNSRDLERGNPAKGLAAGVGAGEGDWRLELRSDLKISVSAYVRAATGIVAGMNATAPEAYAVHHVFTFNPGSNVEQASRLRLVNPGAKAARARIEGVDDAGGAASVAVTVPAGGSRDFAAAALEAGEGAGVVAGGLGDGEGKWRLRVVSHDGVRVLNLMSGGVSGEQLTNLSHIPEAGVGAPRHLPLFPTAGREAERAGFLRLANNRAAAGSVRIRAFDRDGGDLGEVSLALGAGAATHLTRADLANGNTDKGLPDGLGGLDEDRARVELRSTLDVCGGNYVRMGGPAALRAMHAFAPRREGDAGQTVLFNPAGNGFTSRLRLVNMGDAEALVSITGVDDSGESGGPVRITVAAGATRELTVADLENGAAQGLTGTLGQGDGDWRLRVASEGGVKVVSFVVESSTGFVENVSR